MLSAQKDVSWLVQSSGAFGLNVLPGKQLETHCGARLCCLPQVCIRKGHVHQHGFHCGNTSISPSHPLVPTCSRNHCLNPGTQLRRTMSPFLQRPHNLLREKDGRHTTKLISDHNQTIAWLFLSWIQSCDIASETERGGIRLLPQHSWRGGRRIRSLKLSLAV